MQFDVAVIGAGVIGALTARELSKYDIEVALLEKGNDIALGATKANSGIVHAGFDAEIGSNKAVMNVRGAALMESVCRELDVPYRNNGSLVLAFTTDDIGTLEKLKEKGEKNGVKDLKILSTQELLTLEKNINEHAVGALRAPTAGIVCPYELAIAATENAVSNGVEFIRNCEVFSIKDEGDIFTLFTSIGGLKAKYIVNAAGGYADKVAGMIGDNSIKLTARHGDYYLLDKTAGEIVAHTIFQCPTKMGKGALLSPTVDGNLIVGPSAVDIDDPCDTATTFEGLNFILKSVKKSVPTISERNIITSFSGNRAHSDTGDFILGKSEANSRFINAAGIESPGLSAAPAIAEYIESILKDEIKDIKLNQNYNPIRPEKVRFAHLNTKQRKALCEKNKAYGRIICRCETVTEGEIIDAIKSPAGAVDVDGVKRRTRAGMGRCQGGFCGSKVVEILARELSVPVNEITKFGGGSKIIYEKTKKGKEQYGKN